MATVKFDEGTKFETTLDLQDDEAVIFAMPHKNRIDRVIPKGGFLGLFMPPKTWLINLAITNKRFVTIPLPPNKKSMQAESYYFKDIAAVKPVAALNKQQETAFAKFAINMKSGGTSTCEAGGEIWIRMSMTIGNLLKSLSAEVAAGNARNAAVYGAALSSFDKAHYTQKSIDKYYAQMAENAKARAANMDFSKAGHAQIRDYIVDVINNCVQMVNG